MGFYLTFYSVDKDTVPEPVTGEDGIGKTLEYDEVFDDDAVVPKRVASWKNQRTLVEVMVQANVCPNDELGPWVVSKEEIPLIISEIIACGNKQDDDRWIDYEGFSTFLVARHQDFDFDKKLLIFTAG